MNNSRGAPCHRVSTEQYGLMGQRGTSHQVQLTDRVQLHSLEQQLLQLQTASRSNSSHQPLATALSHQSPITPSNQPLLSSPASHQPQNAPLTQQSPTTPAATCGTQPAGLNCHVVDTDLDVDFNHLPTYQSSPDGPPVRQQARQLRVPLPEVPFTPPPHPQPGTSNNSNIEVVLEASRAGNDITTPTRHRLEQVGFDRSTFFDKGSRAHPDKIPNVD